MTFFSLEDLNGEIRILLENYNNMLFQRKEASRRELFQSVERALLKPLPNGIYQPMDYTRAKVQKIGYVYFSLAYTASIVDGNPSGPAETVPDHSYIRLNQGMKWAIIFHAVYNAVLIIPAIYFYEPEN